MTVAIQVEDFTCPKCGSGLDRATFSDWSSNKNPAAHLSDAETIECSKCDIKFNVEIDIKACIYENKIS